MVMKKSKEIVIIKLCKECYNEFSYKISESNHTINKIFCSKNCATKYNYKNMSDTDKKKRSDKIKNTNFIRYGNEYVINSKYARSRTKEKIGVEYSLQSKIIFEKTKVSLIKNTGFSNPLKNPKTIEKMMDSKLKKYGDFLIPMSKYKKYIFPSGKIAMVQGNEIKALDILITKYSENDIFVGRKNIENEIGLIKYLGKDQKIHVYYPDIYIKSENKIYEVKSIFTYNLHKDINLLKEQACINMDLKFEFLILN
jgi:hypothetical protein